MLPVNMSRLTRRQLLASAATMGILSFVSSRAGAPSVRELRYRYGFELPL